MKILVPNTFYYDRGGDCTYTFNLSKLLESKGHKVIPFAMHHQRNFQSEYSKYFVSEIDFVEELEKKSISSVLKVASRYIYSLEARNKITRLIEDVKPDIAHLQSVHGHITPSILPVLKRHDIPIIWTLHDYRIICPNTLFLSHGSICEACKKRKFFMAPFRQCKKGSFLASLMICFESYTHHLLRSYRYVDKFICPSRFVYSKFQEYGFSKNQLVHIPHFLFIDDYQPSYDLGNYCVYYGRLSIQKGVMTLLKAMQYVTDVNLKVIGEGDQRSDLQEFTANAGLDNKVDFLGWIPKNQLIELVTNSAFSIFPSEWFETFGFSIAESFAQGTPVIGSSIGAIPELINDRKNGLLFEPGNVGQLTQSIQFLTDNPQQTTKMGQRARKTVEERCSSDAYYQALMRVYNEALAK